MPILLLEFCHYLQLSLSTRLLLESRSTCEYWSPFVQLPSSHATVSKRTPSSFSPQFSPSTSVLFLLFSKVGKGGIDWLYWIGCIMIGKSSPGYSRQAVLQIDHASSLQSQPSGSGSASGIGSAWPYQVDIVNHYIVIKRQSHQHRHPIPTSSICCEK